MEQTIQDIKSRVIIILKEIVCVKFLTMRILFEMLSYHDIFYFYDIIIL